MTLALLLPLLQIGGGVASKLLEEDNPKLARNINTLISSFSAGAQSVSSLAGAFGSPSTGTSTGLGIADSKSAEAFKKNPEGIFGGDLSKGMIGEAFGGKNTLPKSLGGAFQSPGWNAPESVFNFNPGKTKPIPWFL